MDREPACAETRVYIPKPGHYAVRIEIADDGTPEVILRPIKASEDVPNTKPFRNRRHSSCSRFCRLFLIPA